MKAQGYFFFFGDGFIALALPLPLPSQHRVIDSRIVRSPQHDQLGEDAWERTLMAVIEIRKHAISMTRQVIVHAAAPRRHSKIRVPAASRSES
ncbi:hypothetical protein [Pandoraea iniqua]|uniref:hypothetical protein n=1 Tax=Pandoraea iniqua TaxID=2508288 RepID=UPI00124122CD|nr:hypothetical protein [Pandoraea iniqua]